LAYELLRADQEHWWRFTFAYVLVGALYEDRTRVSDDDARRRDDGQAGRR
jgi:hypothetical protein